MRCGTDNTGPQQLGVYDKAVPGAGNALIWQTVDMTGGTLDAFVYADLVPPVTLLAGPRYYIFKVVHPDDGQWWSDAGITTYNPALVDGEGFACYGDAGLTFFNETGPDSIYVGLDLIVGEPPAGPGFVDLAGDFAV